MLTRATMEMQGGQAGASVKHETLAGHVVELHGLVDRAMKIGEMARLTLDKLQGPRPQPAGNAPSQEPPQGLVPVLGYTRNRLAEELNEIEMTLAAILGRVAD